MMDRKKLLEEIRKLNPFGHPKFVELTLNEIELHSAKNKDYAFKGDFLGNFKRVAKILDNYPGLNISNPEVVAMIYLLKQLDAVMYALSKGYEGEVENIDSRARDISVYIKLANILYNEKGNK